MDSGTESGVEKSRILHYHYQSHPPGFGQFTQPPCWGTQENSSQSSQESQYVGSGAGNGVEEGGYQQHRQHQLQHSQGQPRQQQYADPEPDVGGGDSEDSAESLPEESEHKQRRRFREPSPWNNNQNTQGSNLDGDMEQDSSDSTTEEEEDTVQERKRRRRKNGKEKESVPGRNKIFCLAEDRVLTRCWLECSEDAINGTEQGVRAYWTKIAKKFESEVKICHRTGKSLKMRWTNLQRMYTHFSIELFKVNQANPSGKTTANRVNISCFSFSLFLQYATLKHI